VSLMGNCSIVPDSCSKCKNVWRYIEFGKCGCSDRDYTKDSPKIVRKPSYKMRDVEVPLKRVISAANRLADESIALSILTKGISEKAQKRNRAVKVKKAKGKAVAIVSSVQRSKASLEYGRRKVIQKNDNLLITGVLDNGLKGRELLNLIEKRAGVR